MINSQNQIKHQNFIDFKIIFLSLVIFLVGLLLQYSAGGEFGKWALKQSIIFAASFILMLVVSAINYKMWLKNAHFMFFFGVFLLLLVAFKGHTAMGATRWLNIIGFKLQPSEFVKIAMIFSLARYFYYLHQNNIHNNIFLIPPLLIITVPFLLIMKQPDLGTAIILLMIGISMLFVAGIVWWKFALAGFLAIFVSPIIWHLLHDYQKKRILIFINPESDKLGSGYNIIQSKIAVGSGGLFGMGLGKGSQGQLGFLPEKHTDFIFSLLNEELGLIVAVIIISMYIMICWQMLKLACNNNNMFAKLVIIGLMNMFIFHVIINIAMVIGLMPVVGIPLPLLSYGGTITTTTLLSFGIIFSVNKAAY